MVAVTTGEDLTLLGGTTIAANNVSLNSTGYIDLSDNSWKGGNIDISNSTITATDSVQLSARKDLTAQLDDLSVINLIEIAVGNNLALGTVSNPTDLTASTIALSSLGYSDDGVTTVGGTVNIRNTNLDAGSVVELTARESLDADLGVLTATDRIEITTGEALTISSAESLNANEVILTTDDLLTIQGNLTGTDKVALNAQKQIQVDSTLASSGLVEISTEDSVTLTLNGSITGNADVSITANDDVVVNGSVSAGNSLIIDAGEDGSGSLTANGLNASTGTIALTAGATTGNITLNNAVTAATSVEVRAPGGTITHNSSANRMVAPSLLLEASGAISAFTNVNQVSAGASTPGAGVTLNELDSFELINVTAANSQIDIDAGQDILLGYVDAGNSGSIDFNAGRDIREINAFDTDVDVNAQNGVLEAGGNIGSAGNSDLNPELNLQNLQNPANVSAASGTVNLVFVGDIDLGAFVSTNAINVSASGNITGALVQSTNDANITLVAGGSVSITTIDAGVGNVTLNAAGGVTAAITANVVSIVAGPNPLENTPANVTILGGAIDQLEVTIQDVGDLTVNGITSVLEVDHAELVDGSVNITADGNLNVNAVSIIQDVDLIENGIELTSNTGNLTVGDLSAGTTGDVVLSAANGTVTSNDSTQIIGDELDVTAGGNVDLDTTVNLLDADITGNGATLTISETDNLILNSVTTQGGQIDVLTDGSVTATSVTSNGGAININSTGSNIDNTVSGSNAGLILDTINAGNAVVTLILAGGVTADDPLQPGDITADELIIGAGAGVLIDTAVGMLDVEVNGQGDVVLVNTGAIDLKRVKVSNGIIDIESNSTVTATDVKTDFDSSITIDTSGDILINEIKAGSISGTVSLTTTNNGNIREVDSYDVGVDLIAANVSLNASGYIGGGTDRNLDFESNVSQFNNPVSAGSSIHLINDGDLAFNTITANGPVGLVAQGGISGDNLSSSGNNITLDANDGSMNITSIAAGAATVTLDVSGTLNAGITAGSLEADSAGSVTLNTAIGTLDLDVTDVGDALVNNAGTLTISNASIFDGSVQLSAATGNIIANSIESLRDLDGNDITLIANGGSITLDEVLAGSAGDLILNATSIGMAAVTDTVTADHLQIRSVGTVDLTTDINSLDINSLDAKLSGPGNLTLTNADDLNVLKAETNDSTISLTSTNGSIAVGLIDAGASGFVLLSALQGDIEELVSDDAAVDIVASTVTFNALSDIGSRSNPAQIIETDVDQVIANGASLLIADAGDVSIDVAVEFAEVSAAGSLTVDDLIATNAGDYTLTAGADIHVQLIDAGSTGTILLDAGGDVLEFANVSAQDLSSDYDIITNSLTVDAEGDFGSAATPALNIELDVQDIEVAAANIYYNNHAPVAEDETTSVQEDASVTGGIVATDQDAPLGDTLTFTTTDVIEGLTLNPDGAYSFDASSYDSLAAGETLALAATVTVTDTQGATDSVTLSITIIGVNDDPTVDAGVAQPVNEGDTFTLNASFADVDTTDTHSVVINWGDDTVTNLGVVASGPLNVDHVYSDDSVYTVTVTVVENGINAFIDDLTVTVNNVDPSLTIGGQASVAEGSEYTLTLSASDVGADTISQWNIDWGDGTNEIVNGNPSEVTHTYLDDSENAYIISATATDEDGGPYVAVSTHAVTVTNVAPDFEAGSNGTVDPANGSFIRPIEFTDPGTNDVHQVTVDYGDGTEQSFTLPVGNRSFNLSHTYTNSGTFTVTVTVDDGDSGEHTDSFDVEFIPPEVQFTTATYTDGEGAGTSMVVKLERNNTSLESTVTVNITGGTATGGGVDYDSSNFPLPVVFAPGVSDVEVPISIIQDNLVELDETITFDVVAVTNASIGDQDTATLTITNEEDTAAFTIDDQAVNEAAGTMTFTVSLSNPIDTDVIVDVDYTDVTTNASDFVHTADSVTFIAQSTTPQEVTIAITDDNIVESTESFIASLSTATALGGRNVDLSDTGVGTIINDDSVTVSIANVTETEGDDLVFDVTLSGEVDVDTVITYSTADGSATTADSDYIGQIAETLTITAGETNGTITVATTADNKVEADETLSVNLTSVAASGRDVTVLAGTGTGTIQNDDSATISIVDLTVTEGGNLAFDITLSGEVDVNTVITYSTEDGLATTADSDYTAQTAQTLTIAAGETSGTITVVTTDDDKVEADETLGVTLTDVAAGGRDVTFSDGRVTLTGVGTVTNDDSATVSIADAAVIEGGDLVFNVTLTEAVDVGTVITYSTADGSATTADSDYTGQIGQLLTIAAGQTSGTITVATTTDVQSEPNETLSVTLTGVAASGRDVTILDGTGQGTIQNDDSSTVSVGDVTATEGGNLEFEVTLSQAVDVDAEITYSTADSSATTIDSDYTGQTGQPLTIPAGQTSGTITIATTADAKVEPDEILIVNLTGVTAGGRDVTILDGTGEGTIQNDDVATLTINDVSSSEDGSFTFTITSDKESSEVITVVVNTSDILNEATSVSDYTPVENQTVTISVGSTSVEVVVTVIDDAIVEDNQDFAVSLSDARFADSADETRVVIGDTQGIGTIVNNDTATLTITDITETETDTDFTAQATVSLSAAVEGGFTVAYSSAFVTADATDVTVAGSSLSFAGTVDETRTINVTIVGDDRVEDDETFTITLGDVTNTTTEQDGNIITGVSGDGTIANDDSAPVADAGGPYVINEGDGLTLDASATSDSDSTSLTYRWDIDGDGDYDEAISGATPTVTAGQMLALGLNDGPLVVTVTVEVSDGTNVDTAQTTLTINNVAPVAIDDSYSVDEGGTLTIAAAEGVLINDTDVGGDSLTANLLTGPVNGILTLLNSDGSFEYVHNGSETTSDSFTYEVRDGNGGTATGTVTITINPVNEAPTANDITDTTNEDINFVISSTDLLLQSGADDVDGNLLSIASVQNGLNGTVDLDTQSGAITFVPTANYFGAASFTFTVSDGNGGTVTQTVNLNVVSVNDQPVVAEVNSTTDEDTAITITLPAATDVEDGNVAPTQGNVTLSGVTVGASVSVNADGTISYQAPGDFNGTDSFAYTITDSEGLESAPQTVTIAVTALNDAPVAVGTLSDVSVDEDATSTVVDSATVQAAFTDIDVGDTLDYALTVNGGIAPVWLTIDSSTGEVTSTAPGNDDVGVYALEITATDTGGATATQNLNLEVTNTNDTPTAITLDNTSVDENASGAVIGTLSATDVDLGETHTYTVDDTRFKVVGDQLQLKSGESLDHETEATVTVNVTATDSGGLTVIQAFTINVNDVNEAPVVSVDTTAVVVDEGDTANNSGTFSDVDSGTVSLSASIGTVTDNGNGTWSWSYTTSNASNDTQTVTITATDGELTATVSFALTVNDPGGTGVPGDLDADGDVDMGDYDVFASTLFKSNGDVGYLPSADYDGDNVITYNDYGIWYGHYVAYNTP